MKSSGKVMVTKYCLVALLIHFMSLLTAHVLNVVKGWYAVFIYLIYWLQESEALIN